MHSHIGFVKNLAALKNRRSVLSSILLRACRCGVTTGIGLRAARPDREASGPFRSLKDSKHALILDHCVAVI